MGSCPSREEGDDDPTTSKGQTEVKLSCTQLNFTREQTARLNLHLARMEQESRNGAVSDLRREKTSSVVGVVIERLVQRLVCGTGALDPRFASKFLVTLGDRREPAKSGGRYKFEYLLRLDALSSPPLYPDATQPTCKVVEGVGGDGLPQGFAKVRVQGEGADQWAEFVNQLGFLRRDKIQERFVELLALSAARAAAPVRPDDVDESRLCGSPGKVVDVGILQHILSLPPEEQVYYGSADCNQSRFPDPRDFRIAIVESSPEVRLRIGFLSPSLASPDPEDGQGGSEDVEVKLTLGIAVQGWPSSSDFPGRVPLGHVDCLLFQQVAQMGFYLVPSAPHSTVRCDDRMAAWQIWFPATEIELLTHYSTSSVPIRVLTLAETIVQQLRGRRSRQSLGGFGVPQVRGQAQLKVVSSYMLVTFLLFLLERRCSNHLLGWAPDTLAIHLLSLFDTLIRALRTQRHRSYFFCYQNIMLHAVFGVRHHTEEDYVADAEILETLLKRLHEESLCPVPTEDDVVLQRYVLAERVERTLLKKWTDVLKDLAPPNNTRSRRMGFKTAGLSAAAAQYTTRQLDYISHLFREMLAVRQLTVQNQQASPWLQGPLQGTTKHCEDPVEDVLYLLTAILEQARELAHNPQTNPNSRHLHRNRANKPPRKRATPHPHGGRRSSPDDPAAAKLQSHFESSVACLVDAVRRDVETSSVDLSDDVTLVRQVLRWLYRALDEDRRAFGPILRPYLNNLFLSSHENCWHLDEWRKRRSLVKSPNATNKNELEAIGAFCRVIADGKMATADAILDGAHKRWTWARNMVEMSEFLSIKAKIFSLDVERNVVPGLQLVFTPRQGSVTREFVALPMNVLFDDVMSVQSKFSTISSTTKSTFTKNNSAFSTMKKNTLRGSLTGLSSTHDTLTGRLQTVCYANFSSCTSQVSSSYGIVSAPHCRLRDSSPLTVAVNAHRRYGHHRGVGDVIHALLQLQKFSVLQEVATLLPDEERNQVLDAIQKLSKEVRRTAAQRRSQALVAMATVRLRRPDAPSSLGNGDDPLPQLYRPSGELNTSSPAREPTPEQREFIARRERELEEELSRMKRDSLLGTVRAARELNSRPTIFGVCGESVFDKGSFGPPMAYRYEGSRHSNVALLELTEDKQLRLAPPNPMMALQMQDGFRPKVTRRKLDIVTKL